jgi:hypothetical protein
MQMLEGNMAAAAATFRKMDAAGFRITDLAMVEHSLGHAEESRRALDEAIATHAGDSAYQIAEVYAWRAEPDNAFEWLDRAFRQQDGGLEATKNDPLIAGLRRDPRYHALLRKMNLPD